MFRSASFVVVFALTPACSGAAPGEFAGTSSPDVAVVATTTAQGVVPATDGSPPRRPHFERRGIEATVIAEVVSAGGFAPLEFPVAQGIRVLSSGIVQSFESYRDGREEAHDVLTLTASRVEALRAASVELPAAELVQADPEAPLCADAPGLTVRARNAAGDLVNLKGRFNCTDYVRADGAYSAAVPALEGLLAVARL